MPAGFKDTLHNPPRRVPLRTQAVCCVAHKIRFIETVVYTYFVAIRKLTTLAAVGSLCRDQQKFHSKK